MNTTDPSIYTSKKKNEHCKYHRQCINSAQIPPVRRGTETAEASIRSRSKWEQQMVEISVGVVWCGVVVLVVGVVVVGRSKSLRAMSW